MLCQGVHLWSIKLIKKNQGVCFCSIGVTTEKNDEIINKFQHTGSSPSYTHWMKEGTNEVHSYLQGCKQPWKKDEVITAKLDCDNWDVTYYRGTQEIKKDVIVKDRRYYFAFLCCNLSSWTHFQIVESPDV